MRGDFCFLGRKLEQKVRRGAEGQEFLLSIPGISGEWGGGDAE